VWTWALAGAGSIVTATGFVLGGLDWRAQILISGAIVGFAAYGIKRRRSISVLLNPPELRTDQNRSI